MHQLTTYQHTGLSWGSCRSDTSYTGGWGEGWLCLLGKKKKKIQYCHIVLPDPRWDETNRKSFWWLQATFCDQRSPGWYSVTPGPTLSTIPAASWPRTAGKPSLVSLSRRKYKSVWHTAVATIYTNREKGNTIPYIVVKYSNTIIQDKHYSINRITVTSKIIPIYWRKKQKLKWCDNLRHHQVDGGANKCTFFESLFG